MKSFNLTAWSFKYKELIYYFVLVIFFTAIFAYQNLGRMEDPDFTIRQMVVSVNWPGATAKQIEAQVTDKIEKKLQDTPGLDYLKSYSLPGQTVIYISLKEDVVTAAEVPLIWQKVRNLVNDMKYTLPQGVSEPYFNDRFDDVFGCIYALTGTDFTLEEQRVQAEELRRQLLTVPNVKKVDLIGVQSEKIYIEIAPEKLAKLGVSVTQLQDVLQKQNVITAAGLLATSSDNLYVRVSGNFDNLTALQTLALSINGKNFILADVAEIKRAYAEPAEPKMFYNGLPAIGLALSMEKGGNIIQLGETLTAKIQKLQQALPLGLELHQVSNQPAVVKDSINEFIKTLSEAIAIVLIISFISLGVRTGIIVALSIPLVIAGVFVIMYFCEIPLHKVSLGALIIALGLLVDDAIIAIEMMLVKMENGWNSFDAACHAYTVTAFPMLTGTLITCAGFIPVGFSKGSASEFVGSIFSVITIALLISWLVSIMVVPLLGYHFLKIKPHNDKIQAPSYFNQQFRLLLSWCLSNRRLVLLATIGCFLFSLILLTQVKQEFFANSTRNELIVDLQLPAGASFAATEAEAKNFATYFQAEPLLSSFTYYLGSGAPRFVLTADPAIERANFAEFVFVSQDLQSRLALQTKIQEILQKNFSHLRYHTKVIQTGTSDPYPVMLRLSGPNHEQLRAYAEQARDILATDSNLIDINFDWQEKSQIINLELEQNKAQQLGVSTDTVSNSIQSLITGIPIGEFREKNKTVDIIFRLPPLVTQNLNNFNTLPIQLANGNYVPLEQLVKLNYTAEEGLIWRRNLQPTITIQAAVPPGVLSDDATLTAYKRLAEFQANLPPNYILEIAGSAESSQKSISWLLRPVPAMLLIIITLLMLQVHSIPKMIITLLTAPLGLIGVAPTLILTDRPLGFVVQLGILALAGIIIRNSVILIDQIEQHLQAQEPLWDAIINATLSRFRPIMLTAAAAILGMLPLASSTFWGPMAIAIAGGLFIATILTLIVLPVLYASWYNAKQ